MTISENRVFIDGYTFIRKDRNRKGGGVGIYIPDGTNYKLLHDLSSSEFELLWIEVKLPKLEPFLMCSVYLPPSATVAYRNSMIDNLLEGADKNPNILILGDFNHNILNGIKGTFVDHICSLLDVQQLVPEATRVTSDCKSLIDYILSSFHEKHIYTTVVKCCISDHYLVMTKINTCIINSQKTITCRNFKNFNKTSFIADVRRELCDIYISMTSSKHTDDLWLHWKGKFNTICNIHAPLKSFWVKGNLHPWVDHSILAKMKEQDKTHAQAVKNNDVRLFDKYRQIKNEIIYDIRHSKKNYILNILNDQKTKEGQCLKGCESFTRQTQSR